MINSGSAPKHQAKYQEHESQNYLALREKWLKHALASRRLSSRGKLVASAMFFYFNQRQFLKDGSLWAWPSLRLLDKATGLDRKTVVRAIEDLEAAGYIKARREYDRERRRHKGNLYLALIPTKAAGARQWGFRAVRCYQARLHRDAGIAGQRGRREICARWRMAPGCCTRG
jgi:hypothetical protein